MTAATKANFIRSTATLTGAAAICLASLIRPDLCLVLAIGLGYSMGAIRGSASTGLYIIAGCLGLKVFPQSLSGFQVFSTQFGGDTTAYFAASFFAGLTGDLLKNSNEKFTLKALAKGLAGTCSGFVSFLAIRTLWVWLWYRSNTEAGFSTTYWSWLADYINQNLQLPFELIVLIPAATCLRILLNRFFEAHKDQEEKELLNRIKQKNR